MAEVTKEHLKEFRAFFLTVNRGHEPFEWQTMLLRHVVERGEWPHAINLPTASGKTACLEIATYALSLTRADGPVDRRPPRRIFFVVDRRIVVDAAYERAKRIRRVLETSDDPHVREIAARLRTLGGLSDRQSPLMTSRLRGGTLRDLRWRENPARPAIVTGTVDQVGSRLLFRGYGTGRLAAPIDAALVGCDSLILVDEAHCAVPFLQTAKSIAERYSAPDWCEERVAPPLRVSVLSATLPEGTFDRADIFPKSEERAEALSDPELQRRIRSPKRAALAVARTPSKARLQRLGRVFGKDELVLDAADRALRFATDGGCRRIAVMVNRVRTAFQVSAQLRSWAGDTARVELMTGRMRAIDRNDLVRRLEVLESKPRAQRAQLERPLIVVATQCLEVGADFSFDALVTECASIDALRQRFGRMDRLGDVYEDDSESISAAVLIRKSDTKQPTKKDLEERKDDPIYGAALPTTWGWLTKAGREVVDFGIGAMEEALPDDYEDLRQLLAPVEEAPVLLPAHLDAWVQTSPRPATDPDPAIFLHGPERGVPEVRIVFRGDLRDPVDQEEKARWRDTVTLLPPASAETLSVPFGQARRWLRGQSIDEGTITDSETQRAPEEADEEVERLGAIPFLIWRGREHSRIGESVNELRPDDTIIAPAEAAYAKRLGSLFQRPAVSAAPLQVEGEDGPLESRTLVPLDRAEAAYREARGQIVLRLHPSLHGLPDLEDPHPLVELIADYHLEGEEMDWGEVRGRLEGMADDGRFTEDFRAAVEEIVGATGRIEVQPHPDRGLILLGPRGAMFLDDEEFGDEGDVTSESDAPIGLAAHTHSAVAWAMTLASLCLRPGWEDRFRIVGEFHDAGKADPRFQVLLHGNEIAAAVASIPLAKGPVARSWRQRRAVRRASKLPEGFRHEMLSMQLAERWMLGDTVEAAEDVILHLIASHHGHARPFAPVVVDDGLPHVEVSLGDESPLVMSDDERRGLPPPERLDSGVATRFWRLTRRYGWWGLAYLEAVFRLADWKASGAGEYPFRTGARGSAA